MSKISGYVHLSDMSIDIHRLIAGRQLTDMSVESQPIVKSINSQSITGQVLVDHKPGVYGLCTKCRLTTGDYQLTIS